MKRRWGTGSKTVAASRRSYGSGNNSGKFDAAELWKMVGNSFFPSPGEASLATSSVRGIPTSYAQLEAVMLLEKKAAELAEAECRAKNVLDKLEEKKIWQHQKFDEITTKFWQLLRSSSDADLMRNAITRDQYIGVSEFEF